jgi:hypothetical protein
MDVWCGTVSHLASARFGCTRYLVFGRFQICISFLIDCPWSTTSIIMMVVVVVVVVVVMMMVED